jgi:hypothetical protein
MQKKPETGEKAQAASDTTALPLHANITSFPTTHPLEGTGPRTRRWGGYSLPILGVALVLLAVAVIVLTSPLGQGWLSSWHRASRQSPEAGPGRTVGFISFESSDQGRALTGQGVADEVQIDLAGIPAPATGNSYYGWLLPDRQSAARAPATALGMLPVVGGSINVLYTDRLHRDLVGLAAAFLVTEGPAASPPLQPSPNQATWRYQATFPQMLDPGESVHDSTELDQLRYLLSEDPSLSALGLQGGLDAWFLRNIQKVFESAGAAQGYFGQPGALPLLRTHLALILEYLDGGGFARLDLGAHPAAGAPFAAQVGLIQVTDAAPVPAVLVDQIDLHLNGVISAPGASGKLRALAQQIDHALAQVTGWLRELRTDTRQLVAMTDTQLLAPQAHPLLNEADTLAQYAFVGQASVASNAVVGGATQIHYAILRLATLPVQALPLP